MTIQSVVFFGAHPDDETVFIGGALAMLARRDVDVHIVCATRGEGGEAGEPPVATRDNLGTAREAELRCAAKALDAVGVDLLGYVDPLKDESGILYPFEADFDTLVGQIAGLCRQYQADMVLTHGADGEYGHPAHRLVHRAVLAAVDTLPTTPLCYTVAARVPGIEDRIWNESESAHLVLDVTPWLDIKEQAALCHESQHALFKRRRKLKTVREALRTVESVYRHRPTVGPGESPNDAFAALLLEAGAWCPKHADEVS